MRAQAGRRAILLGAAAVATFPLAQTAGWGYDVWFQCFSLAAVAAILAGIAIHRPPSRAPWLLLAAGQALLAAGDGSYLVHGIKGDEPAFPGVTDALYLAAYPLIAAGLLLVIRRRAPGRDAASLIDAAIVTFGAGVVVWVFLIEPYARDTDLALLDKIVSIAYPLMNVLLLAVTARMLTSGRIRSFSGICVVLAIVSQLLGDALYGALVLTGSYVDGSLTDLPLLVAYVLWAAAALDPSMRGLTAPVADAEQLLSRRRLVLLAIFSIMAPAMLGVESVRTSQLEFLVTIGASILLFVLVIARLTGVVARHERAIEREHALRRTAAALVAARDRDAIHAAALAGVLGILADGSAHVRVTAGGEVVASAGQERAPGAPGHELTAAIAGGGGRLTVVLDAPPTPEAAHAVETLASQVSLALESASLTEDLLERQSAERFRSLVQHSTDVILVLEPDLTIRFGTPSTARVLGWPPDDLVGINLAALVHPDELDRALALPDDLDGRPGGSLRADLRLRRRDGGYTIADAVVTNLREDASVRGLVLTAHEVSEQRELERQLAHQAFHDALTGLANRTLFGDRLAHALDRLARAPGTLAVVFLDLDDFKVVNDSIGHTAGDAMLVEVAARLRACVRAPDTCARLGGDEFAILLEDVEPARVEAFAARLVDELTARPVDLGDGHSIVLRASAGVALSTGGVTADDLLRDADIAMYEAKRAGKGRVARFEPGLRRAAIEQAELRASLGHAIERRELVLHFQPIVRLATGSLVGVEALVRWQSPEHGLVLPHRFIGALEASGLILPAGRFVLDEAVGTVAQWQRSVPGHERLGANVNISARQLLESELAAEVESALRRHRLDPASLTLEITETVLMADSDAARRTLAELKALGVRIAVDDFGTGYSSLEYLHEFPIDVLKVARSFVDGLDQEDEGRSRLAAAIVRIGLTLGVETVAEGVELPSQAARLERLGCTLGQGFLFSTPLPEHELEGLLRVSPPKAA